MMTSRGKSSHRRSGQAASGSSQSSIKKRRVTPEQMQSTRLPFTETVTFNPTFSHKECFLRQLNWWILDGDIKSAPFRLNKGGPAGPTGECGSVGRWDHCALSEKHQSPPPFLNIGPAVPQFDLQLGLSQAIQATMQICQEMPFEDANVRTALLYMVERLAYQGLAIRPDLDLFSIYAHLKSMSTINYAPPPEEVVGNKIMNILSLATFKQPVQWENRMWLADRIKAELHDDILEVQLYYKELQQLTGNKLRTRLERDKEKHYVLYSRFRLLFPHPDLAIN